MSTIHPTADVHPRAELGADVDVGPYCYVGPDVRLGDGCRLVARVTLLGPAEFGRGNIFYPGAVLGCAPQDLKYKGGPTRVVAGDENIFREHVTVHRGTEVDHLSAGVTRIGNRNLVMVGAHIAHDCDLASNCIIANTVQIAGHVRIEDGVVIGGATAMHHFVTVGRYAYVGGMTRITHDVPPYLKVTGYNQIVRGVNVEGMRRWRFAPESVRAVRIAGRLLYARRAEGSPLRTVEAFRAIETDGLIQDEHVRYLVAFLKRKLEVGVFGRVREHFRLDNDADRAKFYALQQGQGADSSES